MALSDASVLIHGESGTGKELVAAAIHYESRRAGKPYVRVNCAAIPAGLMESELFGHEKGAFTGADKAAFGKFELADHGTILLDEIGDMPLDLQVKLLRVLQEREIERVGGKGPIPIDVRVLCATAKDLATEVQNGKFRQDLFYRLQVIPVEVPPLRERGADILELADFFLREFGDERGLSFQLSAEARQALENYRFPGNVRELRNLLERVTVLTPAPKIQLWDLPVEIRGHNHGDGSGEEDNLAAAVAAAERKCIQRALQKTGGSKTEVGRPSRHQPEESVGEDEAVRVVERKGFAPERSKKPPYRGKRWAASACGAMFSLGLILLIYIPVGEAKSTYA